jgi:replication initiation and membrane attachment protein DnaB
MKYLDQRRQLIEELMENESIEQGVANLIVQIAEKRRWAKF